MRHHNCNISCIYRATYITQMFKIKARFFHAQLKYLCEMSGSTHYRLCLILVQGYAIVYRLILLLCLIFHLAYILEFYACS